MTQLSHMIHIFDTHFIFNCKHFRQILFICFNIESSGPTQTEMYKHRKWLEAGNFRLRKKRNCKVLISFAVTAKLIWTFVFACAKCCFSNDAAHLALSPTTSNLLLVDQNSILIHQSPEHQGVTSSYELYCNTSQVLGLCSYI